MEGEAFHMRRSSSSRIQPRIAKTHFIIGRQHDIIRNQNYVQGEAASSRREALKLGKERHRGRTAVPNFVEHGHMSWQQSWVGDRNDSLASPAWSDRARLSSQEVGPSPRFGGR